MYLPEGSFAPVPTPLDAGGVFDAPALGKHLAWLASEGLEGALILGTNGEFPSFTLTERKQVAEAAVDADTGLALADVPLPDAAPCPVDPCRTST